MVREKGANTKMLKQSNKASIMKRLFEDGAMSRIALAKSICLTGAAITLLVKELLDEGALIESGEKLQRNASGRREVIIDINYNALTAYGINIESDKIHFSLCTPQKVLFEDIRTCAELRSAGNKARYLAGVLSQIPLDGAKPMGTGIGVSGYLNNEGRLINTYGLFDSDYDLITDMENLTGLRTLVSNNVRAQAKAIISERKKDFMFIKHGPGLGAAIINGGAVLEGAHNLAGELGHTVADYKGEHCRCGKYGCLEMYLSETRIMERFASESGYYGEIGELYAQYGDNAIATAILDDCITKLSASIVNAAVLVNPDTVVVAGGIFNSDKLLSAVKDRVSAIGCPISIERLSVPYNIKSIAGARLVFDKMLFNQD